MLLFHKGQGSSPFSALLFGLLYDKDKGIQLYLVCLYTYTDSWHAIVTDHSLKTSFSPLTSWEIQPANSSLYPYKKEQEGDLCELILFSTLSLSSNK